MTREGLFAAVRPFAPGQQFTPAHVVALDGLADAFGLARMTGPFDAARFFSQVRLGFGRLTESQVDGFNTVLKAVAGWPISWQAYALATAWHETARTMQPIAEYGHGKGRKYGVPGRNGGQVAYGRGYVQLTWDDNYDRADGELGLNGALKADYSLAMRADIAAQILRRGMEAGWFTGKKMADYLPGDYLGARRIINGTDKAKEIAGHAVGFEKALREGGL